MSSLTKEQAVRLAESTWWESLEVDTHPLFPRERQFSPDRFAAALGRREERIERAQCGGVDGRMARFLLSQMGTGPVRPL
jgi:hypothetical protein